MKVKPTKREDLPALQKVLDETELFPSEMLPDMAAGFPENQDVDELWMTCESDSKAIGFCYAVPEQLAQGTWNMLAITVSPSQQNCGAGKLLTASLENKLRKQGGRVLIADTSGTDEFSATRRFYLSSGYCEEARIRDFWALGDDKVTFWKAL